LLLSVCEPPNWQVSRSRLFRTQIRTCRFRAPPGRRSRYLSFRLTIVGLKLILKSGLKYLFHACLNRSQVTMSNSDFAVRQVQERARKRTMQAKERLAVTHCTYVIERDYPTTPERVFTALSDPALKQRWFAGGEGSAFEEFEMDFRVGGTERTVRRFKED